MIFLYPWELVAQFLQKKGGKMIVLQNPNRIKLWVAIDEFKNPIRQYLKKRHKSLANSLKETDNKVDNGEI